jgi:DNA-binding transcriptional ArsR family regulator
MNPVSLFQVMTEDVAVKALAALAQSSRLKVFRAIVGTGPEGIQPGQLSAALDIPANTLSFHLKELHHAALVSVQREGRFLRYRADLSAMQSLMDFLTAHCCQGVPCGDAINVMCSQAEVGQPHSGGWVSPQA